MTAAKTAARAEDVLDTTEEAVVLLMTGYAEKAPEPPKPGDIVEGTVLALDRAQIGRAHV